MNITIRTAVSTDIQIIMNFSKSLYRRISEDELRTWMNFDPEGFFVAEVNESRIIGTCSAIRLSPDEGYVGLFYVAEGFRNKGIGRKLGQRALEHLGGRNVGLRTTKNSCDIYSRKYGFKYVGDAVLIYEFRGSVMPFPEMRSASGICVVTLMEGQLIKIQNNPGSADETEAGLKVLTAVDIISEVCAYDRSQHRNDISAVVKEMFFWRSCKTSIVLSSGKVVGFGCFRPVVTCDWIISPLYADTEYVAETILFDLLNGFDLSDSPEGIRCRFPVENDACIQLLEKFGFQDSGIDFGVRFNKRLYNQDTSKIYSYYSLSFSTD